MTYGFVVGIPLGIVVGFLYDMVGRRVVLVCTFLIGAISTMCIPFVGPSVIGYIGAKIVFF